MILKHNRLVFLCRSNFIPEALKEYSKHPEHVAVADSKVRPFTASRACLDFEI
ncbi:Dabb family protein [Treponema succinifaciens]|uniref:Dabb family protein n=1 Tax=Treponema succinifaciens TaxID=167 RepID=UPI002A80117A|nr:Dabb family protein [Treponema succinifaciens]MDY5117108.1 Dabb family protein [Treponema succinifaciens]